MSQFVEIPENAPTRWLAGTQYLLSRRGVGFGDLLMTATASAVARVRSTLARSDDTRSDGQLLTAFRDSRDADAFTALVYRHGPRVLGVCRRITKHDHDADDACQAVFLVLARRAGDIRPPEAVGAWLYGVAYRTAQDARAMSARRRARITPTSEVPEQSIETPTPDHELAAALDAEIARLSETQRSAVILCELEGLSRKEAATRLGIAEGTLSSRLAEARKRLAAGLKRKGFALPAVLAAVLPSAANGSESIFPLACRLGELTAAGQQLSAGVPVTLADMVTKIMFLKKLQVIGVVLIVGMCMLAAGWATYRGAFADEPKASGQPAPKGQPVRATPAKASHKMVVWRNNTVVMLDGDKAEKVILEAKKGEFLLDGRLSPDGKRIAYLVGTIADPKKFNPQEPQVCKLAIRDLDTQVVTQFDAVGSQLAWSPDGKEVLLLQAPNGSNNPRDPIPTPTHTVVDVATKASTTVNMPAGHFATGFSPDGKGFLTMFADNTMKQPILTACLISRDGKEVKTLSDPTYAVLSPKLSPDGKTLLFRGVKIPDGIGIPEKPLDLKPRLFVQPIGGKVTELADVPANGDLQAFCWSPDGKKIAYGWRQIHADKTEAGKLDERETESHLCVCDSDGKNHKTLLTEKGVGQAHITIGTIDWR